MLTFTIIFDICPYINIYTRKAMPMSELIYFKQEGEELSFTEQ
jgi:hypothetical protein